MEERAGEMTASSDPESDTSLQDDCLHHDEGEGETSGSGGGVKRPMNAFFIFCKRHRSSVREKHPHLENRCITKILGEWWASLDKEEKSTYTQLARQHKEHFMKANPDFKWYKVPPAPPARTLPSRTTKGMNIVTHSLKPSLSPPPPSSVSTNHGPLKRSLSPPPSLFSSSTSINHGAPKRSFSPPASTNHSSAAPSNGGGAINYSKPPKKRYLESMDQQQESKSRLVTDPVTENACSALLELAQVATAKAAAEKIDIKPIVLNGDVGGGKNAGSKETDSSGNKHDGGNVGSLGPLPMFDVHTANRIIDAAFGDANSGLQTPAELLQRVREVGSQSAGANGGSGSSSPKSKSVMGGTTKSATPPLPYPHEGTPPMLQGTTTTTLSSSGVIDARTFFSRPSAMCFSQTTLSTVTSPATSTASMSAPPSVTSSPSCSSNTNNNDQPLDLSAEPVRKTIKTSQKHIINHFIEKFLASTSTRTPMDGKTFSSEPSPLQQQIPPGWERRPVSPSAVNSSNNNSTSNGPIARQSNDTRNNAAGGTLGKNGGGSSNSASNHVVSYHHHQQQQQQSQQLLKSPQKTTVSVSDVVRGRSRSMSIPRQSQTVAPGQNQPSPRKRSLAQRRIDVDSDHHQVESQVVDASGVHDSAEYGTSHHHQQQHSDSSASHSAAAATTSSSSDFDLDSRIAALPKCSLDALIAKKKRALQHSSSSSPNSNNAVVGPQRELNNSGEEEGDVAEREGSTACSSSPHATTTPSPNGIVLNAVTAQSAAAERVRSKSGSPTASSHHSSSS